MLAAKRVEGKSIHKEIRAGKGGSPKFIVERRTRGYNPKKAIINVGREMETKLQENREEKGLGQSEH